MDNQVFINKDTYEIESNPNVFNVDKEIAETISILNKKGYYTKASCAGHYNGLKYSIQNNVDLSFLNSTKNDSKYIIREIREDGFDIFIEHSIVNLYVMFNGQYKFETIPEGFKNTYNKEIIETDYIIPESQSLNCTILLHDSLGNRRKDNEIERELEKYRKILKEWAVGLPYNNERNEEK